MPDEQQPTFQPDVLIIPGVVAFNKELQPLDILLYGVIYWLEHLKDGRCFASNATLAKITGSSSNGVNNSLNRLRSTECIQCTYDEKNHRTGIITLVSMKKGTSNEVGRVPEMSHRDNNTNKKYTAETLQNIKKMYLIYLRKFIVDPQDLAGATDPETRSALLQEAAKRCRLTDKRRDKIAARLADAGPEMVGQAIKNVAASDFHRGENDRGWKASLEWICGSYEKIEEWASK